MENIFKLDFKTFIKSPFTYIFFILLTILIFIGRYLINSKDKEIQTQQQKIDDCDDERKEDKKLMQDILFQKELNKKLNGE
jgi:large-conductance mechanosensitive channel